MLYIVPTPLGNLGDITTRAQEQLASCDFIIAENPLTTHKLLQLLKLPKKQVVQFADHNERLVTEKYIARLQTETACLVSDAGTPGISDPGFRLVRAARAAGLEVVALPGANAATTALSASGLPTDRYMFAGFLPKTEHKVVELINLAKTSEATLITYESPQRIVKTLQYIEKNFPEVNCVVARELTKMHEEYLTGTPTELLEQLKAKPSVKGEITFLLSFKK
ncbi:MAG TPA: 16S rRNA (cytidine(1402)-2'-O)-methyltransferase [Patescibacteria group bacterium]|jgi:16S rRNA (cytidine1402-2'-O)-methyltransferase|nr:16S rRNA (cytidine(1402)-2'-O)-methyltransferase [Patescibacteria group bacterium]